MAGIITVPPIHLTARAQWWLLNSTVIMPHEYPPDVPVGVNACMLKQWQALQESLAQARKAPHGLGQGAIADVRDQLKQCVVAHSDWCTGVTVARAIILNQDQALDVHKRSGSGFVWRFKPLMQPTCGECRALFDHALENHVPKFGKYPTAISKDGMLIDWKELVPPKTAAAPTIVVVDEHLNVIK